MTPTDFWYKLVDMTQSNATVFSLGSIAVSEKVLLWVVGISAVLIIILLARFAIKWVLGSSPKPIAEKQDTAVTPNVPPAVTTTNPTAVMPSSSTPAVAGSPQELLADTSDRKRSLHDFITPDTIHADVMKQTLNNDFPYKTLVPDPNMISTPAATNTQPSTPVFGAPAPVLPPLPTTPLAPQVQQTAQASTVLPPLTVTPQAPTVQATQPPVATILPPLPSTPPVLPPLDIAPAMNVAPTAIPAAIVDVPTPTFAPAAPATFPVTPEVITPNPNVNSVLPPLPTQPVPNAVQTPVTVPTIPVQPVVPQNSVLPPLPVKEPAAQMVVGVAENTVSPITKSSFNPSDPIIP